MLNLEQIFNNRDISDSSKKAYIKNIIRLNGGERPTNLIFLSDSKIIMDKITKYRPNTQRNYIISIVSLLSAIPKRTKQQDLMFKEYTAIMEKLNKELYTNNTKSAKDANNWVSRADMLKKFEQLKSIIPEIKRKRNLTKEQYERLLDLVLLALYTQTSPRRVKDYSEMFVVNTRPKSTDANYYVVKDNIFIFNVYKTTKSFGTQIISIPDDVLSILKIYIKYIGKNDDGTMPFIQKFDDSSKVSQKFIFDRLSGIFNKPISASMFRKVYLTTKYRDVIDELERDSHQMAVSIPTMMNQYIKLDD